MIMTPLQVYLGKIESGELDPDENQEQAMKMLQQIHDDLLKVPLPNDSSKGFFSKFFKQSSEPAKVQGLYLWGLSLIHI